jgi:hypothetical protein
VSYSFAVAVCKLFAQLAARGVSAMVPSGDGVGFPSICNTNESGTANTSDLSFVVVFPASCVS